MRLLVCLCLASSLLAGGRPAAEASEPGKNRAFLSRIMGDSEGGARPWHAYKAPPESASAVVEVVGEFTKEEFRQVAFQEFLIWFREDLRRFLKTHGGILPEPTDLASATLPVDRFGGNPVPRNAPLGRMGL